MVIPATGYQNRQVEVADQFGAEAAERVGEIARWDEEGESSVMWVQTGQRGLWINGGVILQIRPASRLLAPLIKADIDGRIPESLRRVAIGSREQPSLALRVPRRHLNAAYVSIFGQHCCLASIGSD